MEMLREIAKGTWEFTPDNQLKAGLFISLVSVWILVGVFSYLNYYTRRRYFSIWTVAWLFYSVYLTICFGLYSEYPPGGKMPEPWWGTMVKQWCISIAAVFMLWGSLRFLGRRVRQVSLGLFLCFLVVWSFVATYPWEGSEERRPEDLLAMQIPIFVLIGGASLVTVWGFMQYRRRRHFLGAGLLCFGFTLWGVFVAMYPLLERYRDWMSTAFFSASVLQMFIAVNMIILVLEQIRHLRERRAARQLQMKEREGAELRNRITLTEERYRILFEQSNEPIVITSREDLRIVGLNAAACRVLGLTAKEAQHQCLPNWFAPGDAAPSPTLCWQAWFEFICRQRFHRILRKDGSQLDVEVLGSPIDFDGATAFQFYFHEMNDRSRLEQQLRRAEKLSALGQMISGVVHELKNPLTVCGAFIEVALMDSQVSGATQERLKTASSEISRAARMLNNFLSLAREGGLARGLVDLNSIIRNVAELRRSEFNKANVEVAVNLPPHAALMIASQDQVQQILIILINNAMQAMEGSTRSKQIHIGVRQDQTNIALMVEDSGPGVPVHLRSKIFEPFYTTKPVGVGTGLGLSVAHTYVTEHGGRISCRDAKLGGALFEVELPVADPASIRGAANQQPASNARPSCPSRNGNGSGALAVGARRSQLVGETSTDLELSG